MPQIKWNDGSTTDIEGSGLPPSRSLSDSLTQHFDADAESEREVSTLAAKTGLDETLVRLNPTYARRVLENPDLDVLHVDSPATARFLSDDTKFRQSVDDIASLRDNEQSVKNLKAVAQAKKFEVTAPWDSENPWRGLQIAKGSIVGNALDFWAGVAKDTDVGMSFVANQAMSQMSLLGMEKLDATLAGIPFDPAKQKHLDELSTIAAYHSEKTGLGSFLPATAGLAGQTYEGMKNPDVTKNPIVAGLSAATAAELAGGSVAGPYGMVATLPSAATAARAASSLAVMRSTYDIERGGAFNEFLTMKDDEGKLVDPQEAARMANLVGALNASLEFSAFIPASKLIPGLGRTGVIDLIKKNPSFKKAFFRFARDAAAGISAEVAVEGLQELVGTFTGANLRGQGMTDPAVLEEAKERSLAVMKEMAAGMALPTLVGGGMNFRSDIQAVRAEKTARAQVKTALDDAFKSAGKSKLRDSNPELYAEHTATALDEHGVPNKAFFQADELRDKLAEQGMSVEEGREWLAKMGISETRMTSALQVGGSVEADLSKVIAYQKDDAVLQGMRENMALHPDDVSLDEAQETIASRKESARRLAELDAIEAADNGVFTEDESAAIVADLKKQLVTAGMADQNAADSLAPLVARANTWAAMTGRDAAEKLRQFGITIERTSKTRFVNKYGGEADVVGTAREGVPEQHDTLRNFALFVRKNLKGISRQNIADNKLSVEFERFNRKEGATSLLITENGVTVEDAVRRAREANFRKSDGGVIETYKDVVELLDEHLALEQRGGKAFKAPEFQSGVAAADASTEIQPNERINSITREQFGDMAEVNPDEAAKHVEEGIENGRDINDVESATLNEINNRSLDLQVADNPPADLDTRLDNLDKAAEEVKGIVGEARTRILVSVDKSGPLFQGKTVFRGATVKTEKGNLIALFAKADMSTFLHETGHIFLDDVRETALAGEYNLEEWKVIKKWLGIKSDDAAITTAQAEKFAQGFERYLMEGVAPSSGLRVAFAKFSRWLTALYNDAKSTLKLDNTLNDEVRGMFDRLLATEAQIKAEKAVRENAALLDGDALTEAGASFKTIQGIIDYYKKAEAQAREDSNHYKFKGYRGSRKAWKKAATEEVDKLPYFIALNKIGDKGIRRDSIVELMGDKVAARLPKNPRLWRVDGYTIEQAAVEGGYLDPMGDPDVNRFVQAIIAHPSRGEWIRGKVAQLEAKYLESEDFQSEWLNDEMLKASELEARAYAEAARKAAAGQRSSLKEVPFRALMRWAKETVLNQPINETMDISTLQAGSRRHIRKAREMAAKGQHGDALDHYEMYRRAEALIAESYRAKHAFEKMTRSWNTVSRSVREHKHEIGYSNQLAQLMNNFGLSPSALPVSDGTVSLAKFIEAKKNDENSVQMFPAFPDDVMSPVPSGMKPGERTLSQLQDMNEVVQFLDTVGRREESGRLLRSTLTVQESAGKINKVLGKHKKRWTVPDNWRGFRDMHSSWRMFGAKSDMLFYLSNMLDGWKGGKGAIPDGVASRLYDAISAGVGQRDRLMQEVAELAKPHFEQLQKTVTDNWSAQGKLNLGQGKVYSHVRVPDIMVRNNQRWTIEKIVAVATHMGSRDNIGRLMAGYGMTEAELHELVSILSEKDFRAIQGMWDANETLWEKKRATFIRINGYEPKRSEPAPVRFLTKDGTTVELPGGYQAIYYDPSLSSVVREFSEKESILMSQEAMYQTTSANSGFMKARSEGNPPLPILLDPDVFYRSLHDSATYITLAESVMDYDKVLKEVSAESRLIIGTERFDMIRPALQRVLHPEKFRDFGRSIRIAKKIVSANALGLNSASAVKQLLGAAPIIQEVGLANYSTQMYYFSQGAISRTRACWALSSYMKSRYGHSDLELAREHAAFKKKANVAGITRDDVIDAMFIEIKLMDTLTTVPGWWAAYEKAMVEFKGDADRAITYADNVISSTQGGSNQLERSYSLDSKGIFYYFTNFMSQNMMNISRRRYMWDKMMHGEMSKIAWLRNTTFEFLLPNIAMIVFINFIRNRELPEVEDLLKDLGLSWSFMSQPFIRDFARAILEYRSPYRSAISTPLQNLMSRTTQSVAEGVTASYDLIVAAKNNEYTEDPKADEKAIQAALDVFPLLFFGIPAGRLYKSYKKGQEQIDKGEGDVFNYVMPENKE